MVMVLTLHKHNHTARNIRQQGQVTMPTREKGRTINTYNNKDIYHTNNKGRQLMVSPVFLDYEIHPLIV